MSETRVSPTQQCELYNHQRLWVCPKQGKEKKEMNLSSVECQDLADLFVEAVRNVQDREGGDGVSVSHSGIRDHASALPCEVDWKEIVQASRGALCYIEGVRTLYLM